MFWGITVLLLIVHVQLIAESKKLKQNPRSKGEGNTIHIDAKSSRTKNLNEKPYLIDLANETNKTENYLSDILNKQSGITLNRYGAPGSFSELSIRSTYSHQANIYIDGILLNDAFGGLVNIEELPIALFDRIEIYRSYIPTHLVGNNIGGALDLIPKFPKEKNLFFSGFAHSLYGGGISVGLSDKKQIHLVNFEGSLNQYAYSNDNGTKINVSDDLIRQRENEDYLQGGYAGIFQIPLSNKNLNFFLSYLGKERGIPGPIGFSLNSVRYLTHRFIIKPSFDYVFSSNIFLNVSGGLVGQYSYLDDPENELLFLNSTKRYSLRAQARLKPVFLFFSEKLIVNTSFSYIYNQLFLQEQTLGKRSELGNGASIKYTHSPWLGYIVVGGKYNYVADTPDEVYENILFIMPSLDTKYNHLLGGSVKWGLYPLHLFDKIDGKFETSEKKGNAQRNEALELFTMVSYSQRTPSLNESYGDGAFLLPNSQLTGESSTTYTVGLFGNIPCKIMICSFDISYFHMRSENLIILISSSRRSATYFNISDSYSDGVELEIKFAYANYLALEIKSSYLRAIDDSNIPFYRGKFLPFKPMVALNTQLKGGLKEFYSFINFAWQTQVYRDRFNQEENLIPNRFLLDVGFIYSLPKNKKYSIIFKVKNILGQFQNDILDYPLPGRTFEIKCTGQI